MKVLSLHQPYATLAVLGLKPTETRSWRTSLRGPLAIHASKGKPPGWPAAYWCGLFREALEERGIRSLDELPRGRIIGSVQVQDCLRSAGSGRYYEGTLIKTLTTDPRDLAFGNWDLGRWLWVLKDPRLLAEPIMASGSQGIWTYDMGDPRLAAAR